MHSATHKASSARYKLGLCLLPLFVLAVASVPAPGPVKASAPADCPPVEINGCPGRAVVAGTIITLTARPVSPPAGFTPTYNWTLKDSGGIDRTRYMGQPGEDGRKCVTGGSLNAAKVCITTTALRGKHTATVTLSGNCSPSKSASCEFRIMERRKASPYISFFNGVPDSTKRANVEAWVQAAKTSPQALPLAFVYPESEADEEGARAQLKFIRTVATDVDKEVATRIEGEIGGVRPRATTELWLVQPDEPRPTPDPPRGQGQLRQDEIELHWNVLPQSICGDHFGRSVRKKYYCVNIGVANSSLYPFQVDGVGFTAPGYTAQPFLPPAGYELVRSTVERGQYTGPRNRTLAVIRVLGPVLTGFTPFFRNDGPRATFSQLINVLSNPIEKGLAAALPDNTTHHLRQLDEAALRGGGILRTTVPAQTQVQLYVFLPKDDLGLKQKRDDTTHVRNTLGDVVLWGNLIESVRPVTIP